MQKLALVAALLMLPASVQAATYVADLSGLNEVPPNAATGTGFTTLLVEGNMLWVSLDFAGLSGPAAAGHIHCCALANANAGVAVGFDIPLVATGSFDAVYDLSLAATYTAGFLTASGGTAALAQARLLDAFDSGEAYVNLHTAMFPPGEIRGQIMAIPEPASWAMMVLGFGVVGFAVRQRASLPA